MRTDLAPTSDLPALAAVHVVVPAHDEQDHVGACLASVARAAGRLRAGSPGMRCGVTVVLDRCRDATAAVVAGSVTDVDLGRAVDVVVVDHGCVGAARRAGVQRVATLTRDLDPAGVLVVSTDADCVVPSGWLVDHVALAADHHLVQGEVAPDPGEMSAEAGAAWSARNPAGSGSLHGANLSFRLAAHLEAGGFPEVTEHEDLLMVRAMKARGARSVGGTRVQTSARRRGRVPGGFAAYLRDLDLDLALDPDHDHAPDRTGRRTP